MTSTQASPRARLRRGGDGSLVIRFAAVAILLVVVVVGIPSLLRGPAFVERIRIVNPTGMPLDVSVARPGSGARLPIGSVAPRSTAVFSDVIDMGADWEIRLVANGDAEATADVSRTDLSGRSWTYTVPDQVRSELASRGGIADPRS